MYKFLITMAAIIATSNIAQGQRAWLKDYGIDPKNPCPVFTQPHRTGPARTEGAGICTNDGLAYNCSYYNMGEEWHYEPKLNLCTEEESVIDRVTGILSPRQTLKFGVNPLPDGGAMATYRIFSYNLPAEHYLATYNQQGRLLDAIALGNSESLNDVLRAEPHGDYSTKVNMGGSHWTVDKDRRTITLTRYHYYTLPGSRNSAQWQDTLTYSITPEGHFRLANHRESGKPAVNPQAERLMQLSMLPLSTPDVVEQWNDLVAKCNNNASMSEMLQLHVARLMARRPQEFITWTSKNTKRSVLIAVLRRAIESDVDNQGEPLRQLIAKAVTECPDATVRKYWEHLRAF